MIAASLIRLPNPLEATGERSARSHDIVIFSNGVPEDGKSRRLRQTAAMQFHIFRYRACISLADIRLKIFSRANQRSQPKQFLFPSVFCLDNLIAVGGMVSLLPQDFREPFNRCPRISHCLYRLRLIGMIAIVVDGHKANSRISEEPFGGRCKVG